MADSKNFKKVGEWTTWEELTNQVCSGDLVEMDRGPICHWGLIVDVVDGKAIIANVNGDVLTGLGAVTHQRGTVADIRVETLESVVGSSKVRFNNDIDNKFEPFATGAKVVNRALSKLGEHDYSPWNNNCEHWASWCRTGHAISAQADEAEQKMEELRGAPKHKLDELKGKLDALVNAGPPKPKLPPPPEKVKIPQEVLDKMPFLKKFDDQAVEKATTEA